ncbi:MAG: chorismate mutase [Pseudomonadota bacterium]
MTREIRNPEQCESMAEVRAGVDTLDAELVDLLTRRFGYMAAAARIKSDRESVRDEARKAEVIGNAKARALQNGLPVALVEDFWERLVEASIAYEFEKWDSLRR